MAVLGPTYYAENRKRAYQLSVILTGFAKTATIHKGGLVSITDDLAHEIAGVLRTLSGFKHAAREKNPQEPREGH